MKVCTFIFDGFADWEIGYILPELRKNSFHTTTVGFTHHPVKSMGGLNILPDTTLDELDPDEVLLFILPGGTFWETNAGDKKLTKFIQHLRNHQKPVAAICGATLFLAQIDLLNHVHHTSNGLHYLQQNVPSYSGNKLYKDELAISDKGVITASGIASLEFTMEIMRLLKVYKDEEEIKIWFNFFKNGIIPSCFQTNS